jgi:hypothetical protein
LAFREHYIQEGVMHMKQEEFMRLKQRGDTVMQYLNKFNHLSQYAIDQVNTDLKKRNCFMRGPMTGFKERWPPALISHTAGLSAQRWKLKLSMQAQENQRELEVTGPTRGLK